MNKKNIYFVIPHMGGGGAERQVSIIANELAKNPQNEVNIISIIDDNSFYPLEENVHYETTGIKLNKRSSISRKISIILNLPKAVYKINSIVRKTPRGIVISQLKEADYIVGFLKMINKDIVHVCMELSDPNIKKKRKILRKIYQRANLLVCQNEYSKKFYKDCKAVVIANVINQNDLPIYVSSKSKKIVAVGRLMRVKNFEMLIKAFSNICAEFEEYNVEIYGEGKERAKLQNLIENSNLSERIILKGASRNLLNDISDAQVFILTSDYEGYPNALVEAMAIGIPVISTDFRTGVARELVEQENGLLVPVGDVHALSMAMKEMLSNKDLELMGRMNREKCKEYYIDKIIPTWERVLDSLV